MTQTPAALGYRMPAEWELHAATWLSWPRREGISFPDLFDRVLPALREMVEELVAFLTEETTTLGGLARDAGGSATEAKKRYELEQIRKAIAVLFDPAQTRAAGASGTATVPELAAELRPLSESRFSRSNSARISFAP